MKTCQYCAEEIQDEAIKCKHCGEMLEIKKNESIETINEDKKISKLKGLEGWLTLVGIGLIITPFTILSGISDIYIATINDGTLAQLITKNSSSYIEWYLPLFISEFSLNIIFIIFASILIYLFFSKNKYFPFLFKIYVISYFVFMLLDYIIPDLIPELAEIEDDGEYLIEVIRSFIYMVVWGSYMHVSKRVKNTFIENDFSNIKILPIILITFITIGTVSILLEIDKSKLTFNEYEYGNNTCIESFGNNSYYSGEQSDGQYLCDCKEGFGFGGENNDKCIVINENEKGNKICIESFGNNSYYSGEQSDGQYLCDCKEGFEFGGENNNTCIPIKD